MNLFEGSITGPKYPQCFTKKETDIMTKYINKRSEKVKYNPTFGNRLSRLKRSIVKKETEFKDKWKKTKKNVDSQFQKNITKKETNNSKNTIVSPNNTIISPKNTIISPKNT